MTDRWFAFDPTVSSTFLIITVLILSLAFLWLEIKRPAKYRVFRIVSLVIMLLSLAAIFLRPSIKKTKSDSILLLTEGYDPQKVDSLIDKANVQLVSLPEVDPYLDSKKLSSINALENFEGHLDYVVGNGLPPSARDVAQTENFQFISSEYPEGIIDLALPHVIFSNRENKIEGIINNPSRSIRIILESPGKKEDSVTINKNGLQKFELNFTPRESGNFLFTVTVKNENEILSKEVLPISVLPQQASRIVFIQNFPTFESQYLKNFLGKSHKLQLRYQLSKNTYRHEAVNIGNKRINKLNSASLNEFDLLIIDSDALDGLSSSEISDLHKSVKDGLGLLVLFNQAPARARATKSFLPVTFKNYSTDTAKLSLKKLTTLSAWPSKPEANEILHPITKNKNRILSGYSNDGFGKVGFQLLQETYHLILDGDSISYSEIWTELIEATSRKTKGNFSISLQNKFPVYQDEPLNVQIISSVIPKASDGSEPSDAWRSIPIVVHDSVKLSIEENLFIDNIWKTKLWADKPGWHSVSVEQDSTKEYYYVSEKNGWKSLATANSIRETSARSSSNQKELKQTEVFEPVSPLLFYLIFLVSAGMLWLLPKL